jgi:ribosome maturation factor RimP
LQREKGVRREQKFPLFIIQLQPVALENVENIVRNAFEEGRCGEYYLVDLETYPPSKIVVFIDSDEGVSLDACTKISRILEAFLDEEPSLGGIYELEVSSPGVSRPLKFPRQYPKHTGRTLRVTLESGDIVEGLLKETMPESITLEVRQKDKKNKTAIQEIPFAAIREAYVVVRFGNKKNS